MHQLSVLLFRLEIQMHQGGRRDIERVTRHEDPPHYPGLPPLPARVSLFNHHAYLHDNIYPEGVADVVGYWAEDRILGGVTVFDRPAEEKAPLQPPNVYFNACRHDVTYRYFQLTDGQQQSMVNFFLAEDSHKVTCPLPVLGDYSNYVRVDAVWAVLHRHIYRDVWERPPPTEWDISKSERRAKGSFDYPEDVRLLWSINTQLGIPIPPGFSFPPGWEPPQIQNPEESSDENTSGGTKNPGAEEQTRERSPSQGTTEQDSGHQHGR